MRLDSTPKTYFPLFFPEFQKYFPGIENEIIGELSKNSIKYIVIPKRRDKEQLQMKKVNKFVEKEYKLEKRQICINY